MNGKGSIGRKARRNFSRDRAGAAEIVGDILLVAMSVIMVSALALQLSTVQDPADSVRADLVASYDGGNVTILHMGGEALRNESTRFQLFTDDTYTRHANITDGKAGTTWEVGENWTLEFHTTPAQRVKIQVIDTKNSQVILDQVLRRGPDATNVPDLGLTRNDIVLLFNCQTFDDTNGPMADDTITVNVTVHNYGPAPAYGFTVRVSDYSILDRRSYPVMSANLSLDGTSSETLNASYRIAAGSWGMHTLSVRVVPLPNETRFANNYASTDYRVGYTVIASHPGNPVLRIRSIESFPRFPVHGAYVNLTSRISNQGGVPANATVRYYLGSDANLIGVEYGLGVPVGGESLSTIVWRTPRGGTHTIIVNATDPMGSTDEATIQVEVLPTILLVDDDRAGEGGLRDVGASMREALNSVAASFTVHTVPGGGDGPIYDGGERPLKDYDLVIWITGYEQSDTLTANDITQLERYLYESSGNLWLIGQDVLSGLGKTNTFLNNTMKVSTTTPNGWLNVGLTDVVEGSGPFSGLNLTMDRPFPTGLTDRSDTMVAASTAVAAYNESGGGNPFAILFNATTNGTPGCDTFKTCLFGFEPSRIESANERAIMTFEMLRWFEVGATWGRDLGVSDQRFSKVTPAFMETINITIYLRNNGQADEPVDVSRPQLQVGFYVDGGIFDPVSVIIEANGGNTTFDPPTSEIWIPQDTGNATLKIPGAGGYVKVIMSWIADRIGQHTIAGIVDPYDYIQELNENNNQVASELSKTFSVRYGTLVVDDDDSANNGGLKFDATSNITAAYDLLGYTYDQVNTSGIGDGPGIAKMELYNAIIWICGESFDALTANDQANLEAFLDKGDGRYLWLIGPRAVPNGDYTGAASFYRDYLRVARVNNPVGQRTPDYVEGAYLDPIAHGTRYPSTATYSDAAHKLVPYNDGYGVFYQKPMATVASPNEIAYSDGSTGTTAGWYERIVQPLTTSDIANVYDAQRGKVFQLTRTGANLLDNFFLVGDYSLMSDQNPDSLPWQEHDRAVASWSFRAGIDYTFLWHVTDTVGVKHTLTYTNSDLNNLAAEPVEHGLGAYTADGVWHTVTRDLLLDLREGAGNGGLSIRAVDGFEAAINTGTIKVDDVTLSRPFMAIRHDNVTNNFKTVFLAWDPSFVSYTGNNDHISELVYMTMSWFNLYDERPELRVTHLDLFHTGLDPLRDMTPMMGESYMLKARVWNPGGTRGDAVVRFSDGNTIIDSVSVSVERDSYIIAEVIWTPLYAGSRTLSAWVDPDGLLDEIFKFNNRARMTIQTYFFYDDMENGPDKWDHSATIARLNGESTIEYMDPGPVNSNVLGEWSEFNGWRNTTDNATLTNLTSQYHSQSKAFYMHEPQAVTRTPVDVILTCDATGSMTGESPVCRIEGVKTAMFTFVGRMQPNDRGAIISFTTMNPEPSTPNPPLTPYHCRLFQSLTADKGLMSDAIANITVAGSTPFWNAIVTSYEYVRAYGDSTRIRCIVVLTDGMSNNDHPTIAAGRAAAYAKVKTENIPVFIIGYGAGIHLTGFETDMINVANEANQTGGGGGWYYYAPNAAQVKEVFTNISKQIEEMAQTLGRGSATPEESSPDGAGARTILFSDNMETGAGSWTIRDQTQAGTTWRRVQNEFDNSGVWAWRCRDAGVTYAANNDDWLITPLIDAEGYHDLKLSFWHRPAFYRGDGSGCDFGYIFLSNDSGATWLGIAAFANNLEWNGAANGASVVNLDLSALKTTSKMLVAFRSWSDPWTTGQGWSVDDVTVTGTLGWARSEEGGASDRATVTIMQEGFEADPLPGWTTTNSAPLTSFWRRDNTYAHTDTYSYRCFDPDPAYRSYRRNDDDTLVTPAFDLSGGYTLPLLKFWHRTEVLTNDWCYVDVSNDNGVSWTRVWESDTTNSTWEQELGLDLTVSGTVTLTNQMKVRFRFVSNNDAFLDTGWSVDDMVITAVTPPAPPPPEVFRAYWNDGDETPRDKYITTPTFSLVDVSSAKLTFWHKYNLKVGANGGVLQVGTAPAPGGPWTYSYISPTQPYPNNLKIAEWGSPHLKDDAGTDMRWCWNGVSGAGKFTWDFVQADLSPYVGSQYVRVRFLYLFCGGGTGFGWALDDVEVRVHRSDVSAVTAVASDQWELVEEGLMYGDDYADGRFAYSGSHSWWNHNPQAGTDTLKGGIDNSLVTIPIDLSRAKDARLEAKLRFNVLYPEGRPPDGFRVEVSGDVGISWRQINMGVRSSWNVSGTEAAGPDGTSYTGVDIIDNWVSSATCTRINCDISGWAGSVIQIRFRVVTRNDTINHFQDLGAGFGGFFIDDVTVTGNTTTGQGRSTSPGSGQDGVDSGGATVELPAANVGAGSPPPASSGTDGQGTGANGMAERVLAERRTRPGDCWFPTE